METLNEEHSVCFCHAQVPQSILRNLGICIYACKRFLTIFVYGIDSAIPFIAHAGVNQLLHLRWRRCTAGAGDI